MTTKIKKTIKKESKFDYKSIKTFEDACQKTGIDSSSIPDLSSVPEEHRKPLFAAYKLMIIYKAINNGWRPDWGNYNQWKYYPWFRVLSSGFGFSNSNYLYDYSITGVGARLCTDSNEKAIYIAEQFKDLYQDYFLYSE